MSYSPLRITMPMSRINDRLSLTDFDRNVLIQHQSLFLNKNFHSSLIPKYQGLVQDFSVSFLSRCFVYLITETVGDYPYPYLTEKTWKAIIGKVPFMIIGAKGSLQKLQEFGFMTFSNWWDESYDQLPTASQRIESVVLELKKLSILPKDRLDEIKKEINVVVAHNHKHLAVFSKNDLDSIEQSL